MISAAFSRRSINITFLTMEAESMADKQLEIEGSAPRPPVKKRVLRPSSSAVPVQNPLSDEQARSLLTWLHVIRDPIHGDIRITPLERCLIDTKTFQRLRHVKQLAMVDFVYPGAVHNRFAHSIGTLHMCSELMSHCRNSVRTLQPHAPPGHVSPVKIPPYAELLARLTALLHDAAHISYGHVLEREAQLLDRDEWEDPWRVETVFGENAEIPEALRRYLADHFSSMDQPLDHEAADLVARQILLDVTEVLTAKGRAVLNLKYPFVFDLVSNTICADLLDYVQRDMYYAGLTEGLAMRFLKHLAVIPTEFELLPKGEQSEETTPVLRPCKDLEYGDFARAREERGNTIRACRVVLLQYRYNSRRNASTKGSVLAEAIDLVRRRKMVAEKLYFHKTKLIATSMLAAAMHSTGIRQAEEIW
jgi:HD superfamily phosphohydrolase